MSKYDKERQSLGVAPVGNSSSSTPASSSRYATERQTLLDPSATPDITKSKNTIPLIPLLKSHESNPNPVVGEDLFLTNTFPIRQDDSILKKGLKGVGNFGLSTVSAPGELLRKVAIQGSNVLSGKGLQELPKNTSFTQDILPNGASSAINSFQENNSFLGGLATMALEAVVDPTVYIGGKTISNLMTPNSELGIARLDMPKQPKLIKDQLQLSEIRKDAQIKSIDPLEDIQNAYKSPSLRDVKAQEFSNSPIGLRTQGSTKGSTQADITSTFGGSRDIKTYSFKTGEQRAMDELNQGMQTAQNYVKHNDVLAAYPQGTTVEQAYAHIKANTGVDIPALAENLLKAQQASIKLSPERLQSGRVAGVIPNLKPRDTFKPPLPQRILPEPLPLRQWTNKDNIPSAGNLPLKSITQDNLGQLPDRLPSNPIKRIGESKIPINNVSKSLDSRVSNKPTIPLGTKERGFSANTRTDINNPDALRDSYSTNPLTYEQLGNPTTLTKAQTIFDQGYESARTQLNDLALRMQPEAIPLAKLLSRQATEAGNIQGAREIISTVAEKLTQAGQFGQAARILRESDPETFLMTISKQLKTLNKEGLDTYGKKWKNFDLTPDELAMVGRIERGNQQSYENAFEQIQARIANEMPSSAFEKINAWRHISMLLNPKTHIRNVGGNAIMMGMRKSAQRVSGGLQKVFLKAEDRTQSVFINKEYKDLASNYFEVNKKDLLSGANKYQEGVTLNMKNKRVFRKSRIGEKLGMDIDLLEKTRKFNYDLLQRGDTPFFQNAYIDRLASYAQSKGIKDFSKLDQEAFDIAKLEAEQATYKDASFIADFLNKAKNPSKDAGIGRKTGAVLTEAALPFTKTPINIIKRGIQYSPIGVINGLSKIRSQQGAAFAIDEMAKGLTGTGVLGLGYLLASKGILTGKAEKDIDLREYNKNTGNSPFSILGKYSYDWMQPFSVPLSVGVEIYNAIKDKPEDVAKINSLVAKNDTSKLEQMALTVANGIMEGLNASGDTVFNMSIMKGIKTLLGSGTKGFMEGLAQLPQGYATQFIPTVSNQLAGTIDPLVRQTYIKGDLPKSFGNALVSRIPIASTTLQPKQTPFGEDVKKIENPIGRAFSQFLSPGIIAKDQNINPKIDSELRRLNEFGFTNQLPTMVPNYIEKTKTHPKIELTPNETTEYQKLVGQLTSTSFDKVINSSSYRNIRDNKIKSADEMKADILAKIISDAKAQAKREMLKSKGLK